MYEAIYLILSQFWNFICHLITVFHAFQYLKGNWSSENKTFFLFLSMPGIIIAPNRNICYNSLITVFHIFQYLKDNCSSGNKSSFSSFYIPDITIPPYRNILPYLSPFSMLFHIQKTSVLLENEISPSISLSMPGIIIPPYRNIYSTLLITLFHAFPYSNDNCSSRNKMAFL